MLRHRILISEVDPCLQIQPDEGHPVHLWQCASQFPSDHSLFAFVVGVETSGLHALVNLLRMPVHRIELVTDLSDQTVGHLFSLPAKQNTGVLDCPGNT